MSMQVEFSQYVVSLARGVLAGIGDIPDPDTQDFKNNVLLAQHSLGVLKMLKAKTAGNLTEEERNLIEVEHAYKLMFRIPNEMATSNINENQ